MVLKGLGVWGEAWAVSGMAWLDPSEGLRQFPICVIWVFHLKIHFLRAISLCGTYLQNCSFSKDFFWQGEEKPFMCIDWGSGNQGIFFKTWFYRISSRVKHAKFYNCVLQASPAGTTVPCVCLGAVHTAKQWKKPKPCLADSGPDSPQNPVASWNFRVIYACLFFVWFEFLLAFAWLLFLRWGH